MTPTDFEYLAKLLKERSGLVLEEKRAYLLDSRLDPMARKRGLRGVEDLIKEIQTHRDEGLIAEVVDVMTTNESLFFRDRTPFQHFEKPGFRDEMIVLAVHFARPCRAGSVGHGEPDLFVALQQCLYQAGLARTGGRGDDE